MKKTVVIALVVAMTATTGFARPTVTAGNGLFRVQNAENMGKGALGFNLHWAGPTVGGYHLNDAQFSTWDAVIRLGASYAPMDYLEIGLVPALGYYKPHVDSATDIGLWDIEANLKGSYPDLKVLKLGAQARLLAPLAQEPFIPADYTNGLDIGLRALLTTDFRDIGKIPALVHVNGGYLIKSDEIAGARVSDCICVGAGLEIPIPFVTFIAEFYTEQPTDGGNGDMWLSPTVRLTLPYGFNLDYAMDFLIFKTDDDPREDFYRTVTMGISWSTPEKKHVPMGAIAGSIKDEGSGLGIVGKVSYSGPATGVIDAGSMGFKFDSLAPGTYTFEASAEGYTGVKKTVVVMDGEVAQVDFLLKAAKVTFSGTISDREKDTPLSATVKFTEASIPEIRTDPATGIYTTELEPGAYGIEVSCEGYLPQIASVIVGKTGTVKDFKLVKVGMKIAFRGINFKTAESVILSESYPILDEAAQILKDNPDIRVEIGGHTDSRGSDSYNLQLSQDRAAAVRLYLIENHGIESNRMLAKGYGETQPVAPNDTEDNMFLNRRVEFTILSK
ncbi:OmpA family protein [candidate division WOR-3 bacterium]|nr:OmpA family protein [candidate division WOR-3 bacterium]